MYFHSLQPFAEWDLNKKKLRKSFRYEVREEEENGSHKFPSTANYVEQEHGEGLWMKKKNVCRRYMRTWTTSHALKYSLDGFSQTTGEWLPSSSSCCTSFLFCWCNSCDIFPLLSLMFVAKHNVILMKDERNYSLYSSDQITWNYLEIREFPTAVLTSIWFNK